MISKIDILGFLAAKWFWFVALLMPFKEGMYTLVALIALDFLSGIFKVYWTKGWGNVTSLGMRKSISKLTGYAIFIVAGILAENISPGGLPFMKMVIGFIGMVELKSISENVGEVLGMNPWQYVRRVFDKNTGLMGSNEEENKEDA